MRRIGLCAVGVAAASLLVSAQGPRLTVITGATLIDGTTRPAVVEAVIVIDGSRISRVGPAATLTVPPDATVIDARGKYVIPGLADMHHHLLSGGLGGVVNYRLSLRRMLAVGVTTVFDPSIPLPDFVDVKAAAAEDTAPYARFFSTGPIVSVKGDTQAAQVGAPMPETAADAVAAVRELKAAGVHALKIQRDDLSWAIKSAFPLMKTEVMAALIEEAHRQGLKVFAHAPMLREAKAVLRAGGDGLMHGIIDQPVDQEFLDLMMRNRASYVSTMALYHDVSDVAAWAQRQAVNWDRANLQPPRLYASLASPFAVAQFQALFTNSAFTKDRLPVQRANLKAVFSAGIPVVLGTDTGFLGILIGAATQVELELLVEAGLSPEDALRAATINAARMIGRETEFGTVEAGKAADLVVLDADPRADIRNVARIHRTFKGGVPYDPVDPARPLGPPRP